MLRIPSVLAAVLLVTAAEEPRAAEWQSAFTESRDGTRIAYYVAGDTASESVPLFVVSGGPGSDHRYMRVGGSFDRLSQNRPVIMFDQRGTSRSGDGPEPPRLNQWADDVEAVRAAFGAPRIHLLGHSFGGIVAMNYAERFSDRVASIVFNNSTAASIAATKTVIREVFPDRIDEWQQVRANLPSRFKASEIAVFTKLEFVDLERLDVFLASIADFTYNIDVNNALREDMASLDYADVLGALTVPT
ncbi:MAG: alpha/beta hydrolase, partial [Pseudomonadota bacterium]